MAADQRPQHQAAPPAAAAARAEGDVLEGPLGIGNPDRPMGLRPVFTVGFPRSIFHWRFSFSGPTSIGGPCVAAATILTAGAMLER